MAAGTFPASERAGGAASGTNTDARHWSTHG